MKLEVAAKDVGKESSLLVTSSQEKRNLVSIWSFEIILVYDGLDKNVWHIHESNTPPRKLTLDNLIERKNLELVKLIY
jgi:hypothetical protein